MARWFRPRFADGMIDAFGARDESWLLAPGAQPIQTAENITWVDDGYLYTGKPVGSAWGTSRRLLLAGGEDDLGRRIKFPRLYDQIPTSYFGIVATKRITEAVMPEVGPDEVEFLRVDAILPSREVVTCYLWNVLKHLPCLHRTTVGIEYLCCSPSSGTA